jgi:hypothetical protein
LQLIALGKWAEEIESGALSWEEEKNWEWGGE